MPAWIDAGCGEYAQRMPRAQLFRVLLPLDAAIFDRLGVRYVVEVDFPQTQGRIDGFDVIGEREGLRLLERSRSAAQ